MRSEKSTLLLQLKKMLVVLVLTVLIQLIDVQCKVVTIDVKLPNSDREAEEAVSGKKKKIS